MANIFFTAQGDQNGAQLPSDTAFQYGGSVAGRSRSGDRRPARSAEQAVLPGGIPAEPRRYRCGQRSGSLLSAGQHVRHRGSLYSRSRLRLIGQQRQHQDGQTDLQPVDRGCRLDGRHGRHDDGNHGRVFHVSSGCVGY